MKDREIKEAICELYESISAGGFTPRASELIEKFRKEIAK